jgi:hypothetical protein
MVALGVWVAEVLWEGLLGVLSLDLRLEMMESEGWVTRLEGVVFASLYTRLPLLFMSAQPLSPPHIDVCPSSLSSCLPTHSPHVCPLSPLMSA